VLSLKETKFKDLVSGKLNIPAIREFVRGFVELTSETMF